MGLAGCRQWPDDLSPLGTIRPPCGGACPVALRLPGAGPKAGRFRLGSSGVERRAGPSASLWADPLGLVAPGLAAPGEVPPGRDGLLALGRLGAIGRVRADDRRLGGVRAFAVLGL